MLIRVTLLGSGHTIYLIIKQTYWSDSVLNHELFEFLGAGTAEDNLVPVFHINF